MKNPFAYGRELDPAELVDREDDVRATVGAVMDAGTLFLIGPRRYGKTSILHAARERATEHGAVVLCYNAEVLLTVEQLAARIAADTASQLTTSLGKARRQPLGVPLLAEALDSVNQAARKAGKPIGIFLDEFQAVVEDGGAEAEGQIRAAVEQHAHVGYVFAGSATRMLADMTSAPNRPFHKLGEVRRVGPLPRNEFTTFLERGFLKGGIATGSGAVDAILDVAQEVPYTVQLIAHACWETCREEGARHPAPLTPERVRAIAQVAALRHDPLYAQLWTNLPSTQRKAVLALVRERGQGLASTDVALRYDIPVASLQKALSALELKGIVREEHARGASRLRLDDPLFGTWLSSVVPV